MSMRKIQSMLVIGAKLIATFVVLYFILGKFIKWFPALEYPFLLYISMLNLYINLRLWIRLNDTARKGYRTSKESK